MTEQATLNAVRQSVTVPLSQEGAFELFVDEFSAWWPLSSHHIGERSPGEVIIEAQLLGLYAESARA